MLVSFVVIATAGNAYLTGLKFGSQMNEGRDVAARQAAFEAQLADLFNHAYIDSDATNTTTFFVSGDAITSATPQTGTQSGSGNSSSDTTNSLVFTVLGRRLPSTLLASPDDFETNNSKFGPEGGVSEVELGTSPVGSDTSGQPGGLYLRTQAPSDADPSQGGYESKISTDIDTISYEFYDGTEWQTTWDTTTMGTRRLPSAVRVTYRFLNENEDHIVVFAVPSSDVTPDNPVAQETAT